MARVMVADDDGFMRMFLTNILTKNGHEVVNEACNGEDSVKKYLECKPDLVFMDIIMPNMEGITALKNIIDINPDAKVVMCSCVDQKSMIAEAIKLGARDFIVKPFKMEKVVDVLNKVA